MHVPSDESGDDKIESIDDPKSLIALLEGEENTGKETINDQGRVPSCVDSDDSTCDGSSGRSWYDCQRLPRNCTRKSLTLTLNNCTEESTELSYTLIRLLEGFISLKSLTVTLNEYNNCKGTYAVLFRDGLRRNTSLISLTLTVNIYNRSPCFRYLDCDNLSVDGFVSNISMDSFTLIINDFRSRYDWDLKLGDLWPNCKSLNTLNLTLNNYRQRSRDDLPDFFNALVKVNSLRTLRLKINGSQFTSEDDFSELVVKCPSLELIEVTICRYGLTRGWLETLKWEKQ